MKRSGSISKTGLPGQGVRNRSKTVSQFCAQAFYLILSVIKYICTRYNLFGKVTESRASGQRPVFCFRTEPGSQIQAYALNACIHKHMPVSDYAADTPHPGNAKHFQGEPGAGIFKQIGLLKSRTYYTFFKKKYQETELSNMKEILVTGNTLPEAYHKALAALEKEGETGACEDWGCSQKEVSMTMVVEHPLAEPMISRLFIGGPAELEQYRMEMLDGILDFEIEKGNWKYTYHDRIKDQIPFIIEELKRSPSSRRAVMTVRTPEDIGSEDPACMQHLQYFIRNGKLECKVLFRSNDACKASFMNAFAIIMLQKRIADALGVPMGSYCHRANSYHCYEKDFDMLKGYLKRIEEDDVEEITFDYEDDWKEMMEDARPAILSQVETLKKQQ